MNDVHHPKLEAPQLRTLLLTDLCDSTALVEKMGDNAAAELFREHDRLVLNLQREWRGRLIDRSDGLLLLFERPIDGLGFALDYMRGLQQLGQARKLKLLARAGLHVGEVLTWRNSEEAVSIGAKPMEVEGLAKPMAARLMTLARPGQILLSAVAESLTHRAARELGERGQRLLWKSHGRWRFKGVPTAQEIYEVGEVGLTPLRAPKGSAKVWRDTPLWRRPASLVAEVALLAAVAIAIWFFAKPEPAIAFSQRDWVVLAGVKNLTTDPSLSEALDEAFRISLEQSRFVNVLSGLKVGETLAQMKRSPDADLTDRTIAAEVALRDGARVVILPSVAEVGGKIRFSVEVLDPQTRSTVYARTESGAGKRSLLSSIDKLTRTLRTDMGEALGAVERSSAPLPSVATDDLDALRAYALAERAVARRQWPQAIQLYEQAKKIDPNFALAYMGVARIRWAMRDRQNTIPLLEQAWSLQSNLPNREKLYLDAWRAEALPGESALPKWMLLAELYPDFFAGTANSATHLMIASRYEEAIAYARKAAVPQDPLRAYAIETIGRSQLAIGGTSEALASFNEYEGLVQGRPALFRSVALELNGDAEGSKKAAAELLESSKDPFSKLGAYLIAVGLAGFKGQHEDAVRQAAAARELAKDVEPTLAVQYAIVEQAAMVSGAQGRASKEALAAVYEELKRMNGAFGNKDDQHLFRMLAIAYLCQRSGFRDLEGKVLNETKPWIAASSDANVTKLLQIVQANELVLNGQPRRALALLAPHFDGAELIQAHVVAMEAARRDRDLKLAESHRDWLRRHAGRAFVEYGVDLLLMPLNAADVGGVLQADAISKDGVGQALRQDSDRLASRQKMKINPALDSR